MADISTSVHNDIKAGRIEKSLMTDSKQETESKPEPEVEEMKNLEAKLKKLNPAAQEFFPSRRRNSYSQGCSSSNGQSDLDSIRRTVHVSYIDQTVTEEFLARLFSRCGHVIDCRIRRKPRPGLAFALVEFSDYKSAVEALSLSGSMIGYHPVKVSPSRTAIVPLNPTLLPTSEDERERSLRTIYCSNIDKKVRWNQVKSFFESAGGGKVTRLRLLGDKFHLTRSAFIEFSKAESAAAALNCNGEILRSKQIRVVPSKTPFRPRFS